jgi:hypothetical protein
MQTALKWNLGCTHSKQDEIVGANGCPRPATGPASGKKLETCIFA